MDNQQVGGKQLAQKNSFDIASRTDLSEVRNAVQNALKEIRQRFDFKGSQSNIKLEDNELILVSEDDYKLGAVREILERMLVRRKVSLKAIDFQVAQQAGGGMMRRNAIIQQGIPIDKAKEIVKLIKQTKLKVQMAIQDDLIRVSGKNRDALQEVIHMLKAENFGIDMQFTNYRSK